MPLLALVAITVIALFAYAARVEDGRPDLPDQPELSDASIAQSLGRLVRDGAVTVEDGLVHATGRAAGARGPLERKTLAAVREAGPIEVGRLFATVRETR